MFRIFSFDRLENRPLLVLLFDSNAELVINWFDVIPTHSDFCERHKLQSLFSLGVRATSLGVRAKCIFVNYYILFQEEIALNFNSIRMMEFWIETLRAVNQMLCSRRRNYFSEVLMVGRFHSIRKLSGSGPQHVWRIISRQRYSKAETITHEKHT